MGVSRNTAQPAEPEIDFSAQIQPIISAKCYSCHGPDENTRKARLRLDVREDAIRERDGILPINPGNAASSEVMLRITATDEDDLMPPAKAGHPLTEREIELIRKWIQQGAPYASHWAFTKPERPELPKVRQSDWPKNAIDIFILAKLEQNGLQPSPPADAHALLRRLSLDLIGLPPSPAEVEEFVNDPSSSAYERFVERMLASPAYGEKWARMWLDLARYADSYGYGQDSLRQNNPWPYRDWVINAFNRNLPFDQFTIEQLAGDLLPNATEEQRIATAFHRNTMTNVEGGTDDEEWRVAAVKDRANVTAQAWMGLTMGCAQCHTHKFDPISLKEYYQFYAFFNQTEDNDQPDERPTMPFYTSEQLDQTAQLQSEIASLEQQAVGHPELASEFAAWEAAHRAADAWRVVAPAEITSTSGTRFTKLEDHSLLAGPKSPEKDTYTLKFTSPLGMATALRLEVLPDDSLPARGPGRTERGNFVLNELRVTVRTPEHQPKRARFVRIELPGKDRILSLAEVQVFSGGDNVARNGKATQSSVDYAGVPERAIDGTTNGDFDAGSTTHTRTERDPWWEVDLGEELPLDSIAIWNRTGGDIGSRLANFRLQALAENREAIWTTQIATAPKPSLTLRFDEQTVALQRATATHSQGEFEVSKVLRGGADAKSGWAVGGDLGEPQYAVFEFSEPIPPGEITLKLVQNFGGQHTMGRFRLALTDSAVALVAPPARMRLLLATAAEQRSMEQCSELLQWYQQYANATKETHQRIASLRKELEAIKPPQVPVMRELASDKQRVTRLLNKGDFLDPGEAVSSAVPAAFGFWPADAPTNRLGVAQWLMSSENPLTARVMANRLWAQIFGLGIVETEEDFGTQGNLPSHPELLDWLALELREGGWDIKRFLKLIVTSATYQQTARVTPELLARDPRNVLLSRSPRRRLEAETIRDQALALSGLLSQRIGGPSVYPPQPAGLWRVAFDGQRDYPTSTGEDRHRRGLYTVWRRTIPYPSMATFDAPSRETCTFRRLPTNTPLQAYVTLNDPVFVEAAQALGRRLTREGGATAEARIRFGLRLVLARPPEAAQVEALLKLFESELAHYRGAEQEAIKLATEPLGPLPEGLSAAEAAAWTVVANVLLNLDGVLTRG
ncbi:MAG: DUF1553 domain-containing protein [Verrucomicrobiae bacterium]|nr:DUF1553 domain-containing protein [Verrucomicrobiae bacterium]